MRNVFLICLLAGTVGCSGQYTTVAKKDREWKLAEPSSFTFEAPFQVLADGQPISVEAPGYACPTMADVEGDGLDDLVVGQFNDGKLRFFKNMAASESSPEFAAGEWLLTKDDPAIVPGVW